MSQLTIGLMGLGQIGRQIYRQSLSDDRIDIVAVSDIGRPDILHHLLATSMGKGDSVDLNGNYLVAESALGKQKTRLMSAERPDEIPWDLLGVDVVIDATGRYRSRDDLAPHLRNGARRVITSSLPEGELDRVVLCGVNEASANVSDSIVSAGSASTTAMAIALRVVTNSRPIAHATMTSVHAYTSDQSLHDHAGPDYRRSRAAAGNIIPNTTPAIEWVERALPEVQGKVSGFALNVPVAVGSLLDLTLAFPDSAMQSDEINELFEAAAEEAPELIAVTWDPIVSSDVRGRSQSILVDLKATMAGGGQFTKLLAWHETLGHAQRILDLANLYANLDAGTNVERAG